MIDDTDRGLIHALHIDGRAPFNRIAAVLGVSTQTAIRRYRKLRGTAGLRVVALSPPDHTEQTQWLVRLNTSPPAAQTLARTLTQHKDVSWVKLTSGGTEIVAVISTSAPEASGYSLLLHDIPRATSITAVSAHSLLHTYLGGPTTWRGRLTALTEEQQNRMRPSDAKPRKTLARTVSDFDAALLTALQHDGRAELTELASRIGWAPATVARRLADLRASGAVFFDVEVDDTLLGGTTQALLWMSVPPSQLDEVANNIAGHHELAFVAATTGPTNLVAQIVCPSPAALHHYLTNRLGSLTAIHVIETAPVLRTVKAAGPVHTETWSGKAN